MKGSKGVVGAVSGGEETTTQRQKKAIINHT